MQDALCRVYREKFVTYDFEKDTSSPRGIFFRRAVKLQSRQGQKVHIIDWDEYLHLDFTGVDP